MCFEATLQHKTSEERASHMDMLAHREPSDASLIILTNSALFRRVLKMHAISINNHSCIPHIALYLKKHCAFKMDASSTAWSNISNKIHAAAISTFTAQANDSAWQ
jgi:hypothetical protein